MKTLKTLLIASLLTACNLGSTSIETILNNPKDYEGKTVTVRGKVSNAVNVFGAVKFFTIDDGTGSIQVQPKDATPEEGSTVSVKGKVKQLIKIADEELTVIVEE